MRYLPQAHDLSSRICRANPRPRRGRKIGFIGNPCTRESRSSIKINMKFKKVEPEQFDCTKTALRPFGCMELWAGNERAHRSLELAGLESDVGYTAAGVARHVHRLLHKFQDIRDTAGLLSALNDAFTLSNETSNGPLRLTTVVTGTFDGVSGEFNFAYAAHPRMFLWRERESRFLELGEGLEGLPLGYITGEIYNQQSVRLNHGDMILAFSDGATEVRSPAGEQLTSAISAPGFFAHAPRWRPSPPRPDRRPGRRCNAAHASALSPVKPRSERQYNL